MKRALFACIMIAAMLLVAGCLQMQPDKQNIGQNKDEHGCVVSAGYSWCEPAGRCILTAEENCTKKEAGIKQPLPINPCANLSTVSAHDACFFALAANQSNISACDRIYDIDMRDLCLHKFASDSPSICENMTRMQNRDLCLMRVAYATNDSSICPLIQNKTMQNNCTYDLLSPCSVISDPLQAGRCEAFRQNNVSFCLDDSCRFDFAQQRRLLSACDAIAGERAYYFACRAALLNSPDECNKSNSPYIADLCYQITAKTLNDSKWCDFGQRGSPYRDDCYTYFARTNKDPAICKKAYLETSQDQCYLNYSAHLDQPQICSKIINSLNFQKCIIYTAKLNGDPAACNALPHTDRISCYNIAITGQVPIRDVDACANIAESEAAVWKPRCFTALAIQQQNSSICQYIESSTDRKQCLGKFP